MLLLKLAVLVIGSICSSGAQTLDEMRSAFQNPPASARPWVHWFWVDGNISREGITADLEAMSRVGIGGAVLMDVALEAPPGPVGLLTPEWREMFNHAVSEASRLGLELSMHNGPGWTGSGGPWVTPELAMQRLVWSVTNVTGPAKINMALPRLPAWNGYGWPVAILAFPTLVGDGARIPTWPAKVVNSAGKNFPGADLWDHNPASVVTIPKPGWFGKRHIQVDLGRPTAIGHLFLQARRQQDFAGVLQVSEDGRRFRNAREFMGHEKELSLEFGAVTGRVFRVTFTSVSPDVDELEFSELHLSPIHRIPEYVSKSGMTRGIKHHSTPKVPSEAIIRREDIVDVSAHVDAHGFLRWQAPPGRWTILRLGHMPTGRMNNPPREGGRGLETDKLSSQATAHHLKSMIGSLKSNTPPGANEAFSFTHTDSWEMGFQNWTPAFRQEFTKRRGYDPLLYLPAMTGRYVGSPEISDRFLWDLRRTIADLQADNYASTLAKTAHSFGLRLSAEAYGNGPMDNLLYASRVDVPMSEFWNETDAYGKFHWSKTMASAAHVYGKPIVAAESFSTWPYNGAWRNHPFSLKMLGDTAFTYGVNRLVFHRFVHQPWLHLRPGMTLAYWGVHYERTQTWWEYSKPWHDYVTRCHYLLQSGKFVADLCYLTDEGAYNEPLTRDQLDPARPEGYDYDLAPPEAAFSRMSVTNGRIVLPDGTSYAALVLPNQPTMTPALLRRIKILVDQGAVVVGKPPTRSPSLAHYPECDREVMALANELWGDANQEKTMEKSMDSRRLIWGGSLEQLFAGLKLGPDFRTIEKTEKPLRYLHRTNPNGDIYFVANPMSNQVTATCEFRILDKTPEVWEPDSGQVRRLAAWKRTSSGTQIQLSFQPFGSCFVVFGNAPKSVDPVVDFSLNQRPHPTAGLTLGEDGQVQLAAEKPGLYEAIRSSGERLEGQLTLPPKSTIIQGTWTVEFPRPDGTALQVAMDKLSPWNEHSHPEVRFFSGAATYRQRVEMVHGAGSNSLALDLGKVAVLADVKINGRSAGTLWKPPFSVEVGHLLKRGANEVEITVVNLWPNRMIGDEHLPSDCEWSADTPGDLGNRLVRWPDWFRESRPRPTQRQTFATRRFYDKNAPLIESGLLGPVVLREVPVVRLEPED